MATWSEGKFPGIDVAAGEPAHAVARQPIACMPAGAEYGAAALVFKSTQAGGLAPSACQNETNASLAGASP